MTLSAYICPEKVLLDKLKRTHVRQLQKMRRWLVRLKVATPRTRMCSKETLMSKFPYGVVSFCSERHIGKKHNKGIDVIFTSQCIPLKKNHLNAA